MLRKDLKKPAHQPSGDGTSTVDPEEVARFTRLADEWWKPDGAFKVVHAFNKARVDHLARRLPQLCGRDALEHFPPKWTPVWCRKCDKQRTRALSSDSNRVESALVPLPLAGLSVLDVGCGAGSVTEPISRLGADVLGIDASERNIQVAQRHAALSSAPVRYRHALPEDLLPEGRRFDIVLSLEVVEHVANVPNFLAAIGRLVAPGGLLVIGTLNRTPVSFLKAIVGAEYVLRWLPRGTHDWRRFVTPTELDAQLSPVGFTVIEKCGVDLAPLSMQWRITRSTNSTYLQFHRRQPNPT